MPKAKQIKKKGFKMDNKITIKDIKKDEMLTLKKIEEPNESQVWLKSHYDKSTKKFVIYNFNDIGKSKLIDGSKEIFINFTF